MKKALEFKLNPKALYFVISKKLLQIGRAHV